jgi:transposase
MNLISAVSRTGQMHFAVVEGRVNAEVFIEFLRRLIHNRRTPVFLVVDGHPSHKAGKVIKYVETVADRLRLFFLPPYSPELNPDELVWNDLNNHILGRKAIVGPTQMRRVVLSRLRWMQKTPQHVEYFSILSNTAAAGTAGMLPRSYASIRSSASCAHASSMLARDGKSKLDRIPSRSSARSMGGSPTAFSST